MPLAQRGLVTFRQYVYVRYVMRCQSMELGWLL
jgi:hypothetical protein